MKRTLIALSVITAAATHLAAQGVDFSNIQVHGYATQGFIYTTNNNWATTQSSDGSPAWTEADVNLTAQPRPKLRIGVQARYFLLGDYGNKITLDWAQADFKVNELFGIRAGKVKTPVALFNEIQDIDPAYLWVLLPQSIYPLTSRNATLAHYGAVVYGKISLSESVGKLEYRGFGGQRRVAGDDGYFQSTRDSGLSVPNGVSGPTFGGSLRWDAPLAGLILGASEAAGETGGEVDAGPYQGKASTIQQRQTYYFVHYEHGRWMGGGEFNRKLFLSDVFFPGAPAYNVRTDDRAFYAMASYRATSKISTGLYYSSSVGLKLPVSSARYQKDWALAARYDFNPYLYAKFEQHFIDGTQLNYAAGDNPNPQSNTRMTLVKFGASF